MIEFDENIKEINIFECLTKKQIDLMGLTYLAKNPELFKQYILSVYRSQNTIIRAIKYNGEYVGIMALTECDPINFYGYLHIILKPKINNFIKYVLVKYFDEFIEYIFNGMDKNLPVNKIVITPLVKHIIARKIAKKAGFRKVGCHQQHVYTGRRYIDVMEMELTKDNWKKMRKKQ